VATQTLASSLIVITTELQLSIWNLVWRYSTYMPTNSVLNTVSMSGIKNSMSTHNI
jgi:hypothetical protein